MAIEAKFFLSKIMDLVKLESDLTRQYRKVTILGGSVKKIMVSFAQVNSLVDDILSFLSDEIFYDLFIFYRIFLSSSHGIVLSKENLF